MSAAGLYMRRIEEGYVFYCPGCETRHAVYVDEPHPNGARWTFDGNLDAPTFSPSLNLLGKCHFFVHAGRIEFLNDSTHRLAGQTVPMVAIDDNWEPVPANGDQS